MRATTLVASREWPPRSKKSSWTPIAGSPSTSRNVRTRKSSAGVRGAVASAAVSRGSGRAFRSTFPLGVRGKDWTVTNADGTMYAGSLSRRTARSRTGSGSAPVAPTR